MEEITRHQPNEIGKRKPRASKVLLYGGLFAFLASWAGILGNIGRDFWLAAVSVMVVASVALGLGLRLELRNHHRKKWEYNVVGFGIMILAFGLGTPVTVRALREARPVKKNFIFVLNEESSNRIELTNDFLISNNFDKPKDVSAVLVIPIKANQSNFILNFSLRNDSAVVAENTQFRASFTKDRLRTAEPAWIRMHSGTLNLATLPSGEVKTNEIQESVYFAPRTLLSGDAFEAPPIEVPVETLNNNIPWTSLSLLARAKEFPAIEVTFDLYFLRVPTNLSPNMPVVVFTKSIPGTFQTLQLSPDLLSKLAK